MFIVLAEPGLALTLVGVPGFVVAVTALAFAVFIIQMTLKKNY